METQVFRRDYDGLLQARHFISQEKYFLDLLKETRKLEHKLVGVLIEQNQKMSIEEESAKGEKFNIRD